MKRTGLSLGIMSIACGLVCLAVVSARANNIVDEWTSVKLPPAPALKAVKVEPKTTALLMLDLNTQNCGRRPRCMNSIAPVKKLLEQARANGLTVIFSIGGNGSTADILKDVAPLPNEPWVQSNSNKFLRTDLENILKGKGIETVIVVGTAAHGAVLHTGSEAALRGMKVVVPVDGMSAEAEFFELSTAWLLANGPGFGQRVTLTKVDMISY
jgi:nicotinamidase-related amidase